MWGLRTEPGSSVLAILTEGRLAGLIQGVTGTEVR